MQTELQTAAQYLADAQHVVVSTGAGVSAESGIATFRDAQTGLWSKFDPETLASQQGFLSNPGLVWRWYMERLFDVQERAKPNPGHVALAELERLVPTLTLVTQNVDGLHEEAGSQNVLHLHGSITRFRCNSCDAQHELRVEERKAEMPPTCGWCGGMIRPDVVWFGEQLPFAEVDAAWQAAEACDVMLVVGTSGVVYPAAHLPTLAQQKGARVVDINPDPSPISYAADVYLQGKSGDVLPELVAALRRR